ncbi:MAG: hypothetical protein K2K96_13935 [Lachnospiraceae bacterium]|nr:hypothetical protein [Lachnospiraceae bacterium]
MDKVLSIFSLLSVIWSNILLFTILDHEYFTGLPGTIEGRRMLVGMYLIYFIVLLYNIFAILYCRKVQREQQTSKIPSVISSAGTLIYSTVAILISLLVSFVEFTGGV